MMRSPCRAASFLILLLGASIFAVFVVVAAKGDENLGGATDSSLSNTFSKILPLSPPPSSIFSNTVLEASKYAIVSLNAPGTHSSLGKRALDDVASSSSPVLRPSSAPPVGPIDERPPPDKSGTLKPVLKIAQYEGGTKRAGERIGSYSMFIREKILSVANSGNKECKEAIGDKVPKNWNSLKRATPKKLALIIFACSSHSEGYDPAAPDKIMADKTGGFAKDYVQQALKEYEADAFSSESLEKRYAKYLEERGKPTMVEFKGLEELTIRFGLSSYDQEGVLCDLLGVFRPTMRGWKAAEKTAYKEFYDAARHNSFIQDTRDYIPRDKIGQYYIAGKGKTRKSRSRWRAKMEGKTQTEPEEMSESELPEEYLESLVPSTSKRKGETDTASSELEEIVPKRPKQTDEASPDNAVKSCAGSFSQMLAELARRRKHVGKPRTFAALLDLRTKSPVRLAHYFHDRGLGLLSGVAPVSPSGNRENEEEEKKSANVYLDVLAREWREAERNRHLYRLGVLLPIEGCSSSSSCDPTSTSTGWMLGQPKASSFVRTEEAKRGPITTTLKVNVSFLLGISQYAFLGWREREGESYRRLLDDIREGRYNHNPFAYVKPEEYDHYHFLGQAKERGGRRGRKVPIIDLNKSPPEEKKGTKLTAFEEEYRRLRDNMKPTTSKEGDVESSGSTRWTPHFPSMVLSDPPYLGPRGLKPDIPKEILEKVDKPSSLLPFPETKTPDDSAKP